MRNKQILIVLCILALILGGVFLARGQNYFVIPNPLAKKPKPFLLDLNDPKYDEAREQIEKYKRGELVRPKTEDPEEFSEFIIDNNFDEAVELLEATKAIISSSEYPEIQELLEGLPGPLEFLEDTAEGNFPTAGIWVASVENVTLGTVEGENYAQILSGGTLHQTLGAYSWNEDNIIAEVEIEFLDDTGMLTLSLHGDRMDSSSSANATDFGTNTIKTLRLEAKRQGPPLESWESSVIDKVHLEGDEVRVYSVSVFKPNP